LNRSFVSGYIQISRSWIEFCVSAKNNVGENRTSKSPDRGAGNLPTIRSVALPGSAISPMLAGKIRHADGLLTCNAMRAHSSNPEGGNLRVSFGASQA
jgi:hypothetical protein